MPVWAGAVLAAVFLVGGIVSLRAGKKTSKGFKSFMYILLFFLGTVCVLYLAAALLLLGGVE